MGCSEQAQRKSICPRKHAPGCLDYTDAPKETHSMGVSHPLAPARSVCWAGPPPGPEFQEHHPVPLSLRGGIGITPCSDQATPFLPVFPLP